VRKLNQAIVACEACPRLRDYCRRIARERRKAYREQTYWGRPVPNFGDGRARLLIIGLAPAAHGANRTGRMFTGDESGRWLYRALHRAGFANQEQCDEAGDGLRLSDCAITAVCHCAPPDNKPVPEELARCRPWLAQTLDVVPARVYLALGQIAWNEAAKLFRERGWLAGARPKFAHGATIELSGARWLIGSYHPSQQNTFTGRLTREMLDEVFALARRLLNNSRG
jgi:uracil-DNA glycosylase family 4